MVRKEKIFDFDLRTNKSIGYGKMWTYIHTYTHTYVESEHPHNDLLLVQNTMGGKQDCLCNDKWKH